MIKYEVLDLIMYSVNGVEKVLLPRDVIIFIKEKKIGNPCYVTVKDFITEHNREIFSLYESQYDKIKPID
jgi:hypothetical protein